ncbi:FxDxF family PEP-CTERM protein [Aquincola tertiaricarbonis]|uniref:FxDxF family PEP-CTERM protein n=1 Tax=Aquincola tertiaricarbonis TaxID=391953 RepID=A0ABY4SAE2_AQUTE|nr:FxDxF family PEP-CTERM protein [Aquincola tertiaricarbonis]URI09958.1 FxDxF family PEP-CTERM protein [Aquincola tertiaricarbonis]
MKQLFKQTAVLAAVVLACAQANAASTVFATSFEDSISVGGTDLALVNVAGNFRNTFGFTLTSAATITAGLSSVIPSTFGSAFFTLENYTSSTPFGSGAIGEAFTATLAAGDYFYSVKGVGAAGSTYALKSVVAAVPEPETYALFLAGLGAVGFLAARRRSN